MAKAGTVRARIRQYLGRWPGKTATQVARAIKADPATVSSILYWDHMKYLVSRDHGGGPRGGHRYYSYNE